MTGSRVTQSRLREHAGHRHEAAHAPPGGRLEDTLRDLGPGDHLCLVYDTQEEQFAGAVPFVRIGLDRKERCLYVADDNTVAAVKGALADAGIDVAAAEGAGDLLVTTKRDTYLRDGTFDPDGMVRFLAGATEEAGEVGYHGLRVTGEMTWALGGDPGSNRLMEYESKLNGFFPGSRASAICQYNRSRFEPERIEAMLQTHPRVIYGGIVCRNMYYVPPEELLHPNEPSRRVERLLGNILERERTEDEIRALTRDLERRVTERTAELLRANRELESFAYTVSHDIRAPLRGIEFIGRALEEDYADRLDEEGRHHLARLRSESMRATRIVTDLLEFSQATRDEPRRESVSVSALARSVLEGLAAGEPARRVAWTVEDGLVAEADPRLLRIVLENLLGNAWKYSRHARAPRIEFLSQPNADEPTFVVRDNGAGFSAADADRLFAAFQRLHSPQEFEGTGVGLATVRRIIERHGGRVWGEGRVGEGATFCFTLGYR